MISDWGQYFKAISGVAELWGGREGKVKAKVKIYNISYLYTYVQFGERKGELIYGFMNHTVVIRGAYKKKKVGLVMTFEFVETS